MPGPRYLESVRAYPRSFAGLDATAAQRTRDVLITFLDPVRAPIRELPDLESAELGKLLENSYRSANIAFIHEWTRLAESIDVDLWSVIDSIRVRTGTHDNIRNPGLGVGGYCLTKDSLLAQWGAANLLGSDVVLDTTLNALETNYLMPFHTLDHVRRLAGGDVEGLTIALLGVTYLPGVADTRNAPSETLLTELEAAGAEVRAHDPQVVWWPERPDVTVHRDLRAALDGVDGVVIAVAHDAYRALSANDLERLVGRPAFVVDAQNVLDDEAARALHTAGWRVSGVGKGHWRAAGYGEGA
jgi:nucleotide sugar dehydrogenase